MGSPTLRRIEMSKCSQFWSYGPLVFVVVFMGILYTSIYAQEPAAAWTQRDRLIPVIDSRPEAFLNALETVMTQEQISAVELLLFPPATIEEKKQEVKDVKERLEQVGFTSEEEVMKALDKLEKLLKEMLEDTR